MDFKWIKWKSHPCDYDVVMGVNRCTKRLKVAENDDFDELQKGPQHPHPLEVFSQVFTNH
jgi:hypothetical protein